ncbi:MAG: phosphomannomutase/phosphoglucomutase, partial [Oscillospiraceae bacterium]
MYLPGTVLFPLQNGSDLRGVAMEGEEEVNLTEEIARSLGAAFGRWVAQKTGKTCDRIKIGVGCDSRITGAVLKDAFLNGVVSDGVRAFDCGLASTPAMFMATVFPESDFDGAVMVTASHMPKNRNGFKFFTRDGGLEKNDIRLVLTNAIGQEPKRGLSPYSKFDIMSLYCIHLQNIIKKAVKNGEKPLSGLHVVTDAGNGAGGFFERRVLAPLGADTTGSLYSEPDGNFPNHIPNPENKEAMESIIRATISSRADLGLLFDTDVDRAAAVLSDGTPIAKDNLIALLAALISGDYPHCTIVTDSVTSDRLTNFLNDELSITLHRF